MKTKPITIKRSDDFHLKSIWNDGFQSIINIQNLRKECPCAQCQKDRKEDKKTFAIPLSMTLKEGMYILKELKPIGNYAIKAIWGDGHDIGIYDWQYLREVFEKHKIDDNTTE